MATFVGGPIDGAVDDQTYLGSAVLVSCFTPEYLELSSAWLERWGVTEAWFSAFGWRLPEEAEKTRPRLPFAHDDRRTVTEQVWVFKEMQ